jgi:hypothetical protein
MDPLNYHADKCIVLTGLPWDTDGPYLVEYIKGLTGDKNFKVVNVTRYV